MNRAALRVLLMMDPFIAVPPRHYGGIERVIADLGQGLRQRGHDVTLWAAPGSRIDQATVVPFGKEGEWTRWSNVRNTATVTARLYRDGSQFDVVHNFGRLAYLTGVLPWNLAKVQTYMRTVNPVNMRKVTALGAKRLCFTAVSRAIRKTGEAGGGTWRVIYNCASRDLYQFQPAVDPSTAPLVFLGRLDRCKGAHTAITIAERLNRTLIIAGNVSTLPDERQYFEDVLKPRIDGTLIRYIGPVDDPQKNALLGGAAALLTPIEWEEPFPVVLPEAMLCGTPVIGFRRGGLPEGIDDGRTGFICDTTDQMIAAVGRLKDISRQTCRLEAERRFSTETIVGDYESLYRDLCRN
jgi:glycosyltransferase involved in cell wall biosynthesis